MASTVKHAQLGPRALQYSALASDRWRWTAKWPRNKRLHDDTYCFRVVLALRVLSSYEVSLCLVLVLLILFVFLFLFLVSLFSSLLFLHCLHCLHCILLLFSLSFPFLDASILVRTTACWLSFWDIGIVFPFIQNKPAHTDLGSCWKFTFLSFFFLVLCCLVFHPCVSCPLRSLISNSQAGPDLISLFFSILISPNWGFGQDAIYSFSCYLLFVEL